MSAKSGKSSTGSDLLGKMLKEPAPAPVGRHTPPPVVEGVSPLSRQGTSKESSSKEPKDSKRASKSSSRSSRSKETEAGFSRIMEAMEEQNKMFSSFLNGLGKMMAGSSKPEEPTPAARTSRPVPEDPTPAAQFPLETADSPSMVNEDLDSQELEDNGEEEVEEENLGLLDRFATGKSMFVPSSLMVQVWDSILRHEVEYGEDAWTNLNVGAISKKWTGHPESALAFAAPAVDPGLRPLKFQDHKDLDKKLVTLQTNAGGVGAIAIRMVCLLEGIIF